MVQRYLDLSYGTQVKVTISRYYTPSGRCIQALDYSKKDANGKVTKTEAKNFNAFKTRKGRPVYDGGGVLPDIELAETKSNYIIDALVRNDAIFNFGTQYYYKNSTLGDKIPNLTDADFADFKKYIKSQNISFDTKTENALKETLEQAKKEKVDTAIKLQYDSLMLTLQKAEDVEVDKNKTEILALLHDEIIKRFQYKEGLYLYYTKNNSEIKKATQLLNNTAEYNKILIN